MKAFPEVMAIIDTETTGMRPGFARVMDIGIIRVEKGKIVEKYQTFVNPGMSVPGFISSFTGITDEQLVGAPNFDEVALEVERLLKDAVFVAHNAGFDYGFIKAEFARIGMDFHSETMCSVKLSRALFPKERSHSLDSLIARHDIQIQDRHRALPDAEAVWQFFQKIGKSVKPKVLSAAVTAVRDGVIPGVGRDSFAALPDSPGVYMFFGPEQELLYVGKSKNIRTRARSHFAPSALPYGDDFHDDVTSIETIQTSGELSALILESAMVKSEGPLHNRMLRRKKVLIIAKRLRDASGYDRVILERTSDIQPDDTVLAVFRTQKQGKDVLHSLAKENRLCEKLLGLEVTRGDCFAHQLGNCDGACVGALAPSDHNLRIQEAFKKRRIRSWPFSGPILIKEESSSDTGTVFFIDNWALHGAYRNEGDSYSPLVEGKPAFDYDMYKILARFLRKRSSRRFITELSRAQFSQMLKEVSDSHEKVIA